MDRISVDLVVVAVQMEQQNIWMQGSLEIRMNGQKICSDSDIVQVEQLFQSVETAGTFFIFSCSCGLPDCSDWGKGMEVIHTGIQVKWTDLNNGRTWNFDRAKLQEDLVMVRKEVSAYKMYFAQKGIEYVGVGYNWEY